MTHSVRRRADSVAAAAAARARHAAALGARLLRDHDRGRARALRRRQPGLVEAQRRGQLERLGAASVRVEVRGVRVVPLRVAASALARVLLVCARRM